MRRLPRISPSKAALCLLFVIPLIGHCQWFHRKINQWDDKFHPNGLWIGWKDDQNKVKAYRIWYKHGLEYRISRYYHDNGKTRVKYRFLGDSIVMVKYFDENGRLTDKGRALRFYTNSDYRFCWDGTWKHYDEHHHMVKPTIYRKGEEMIKPDRSDQN
ncbi:MAG: hypothetical protein HXX13_15985 [Bacteroidetes bacterium]|nr:hypothetical protein [Bacteroidota bacterium]